MTLKIVADSCRGFIADNYRNIFVDRLKEDAKKEIKILNGIIRDDCPTCEGLPLPCPEGTHKAIQNWIKKYFNVRGRFK